MRIRRPLFLATSPHLNGNVRYRFIGETDMMEGHHSHQPCPRTGLASPPILETDLILYSMPFTLECERLLKMTTVRRPHRREKGLSNLSLLSRNIASSQRQCCRPAQRLPKRRPKQVVPELPSHSTYDLSRELKRIDGTPLPPP